MSQVKSFNSNGKFYDDSNFPYGLDRSGDFTRKQSETLTEYGKALFALCNELVEPINAEEERFLDVCKGQQEAETEIEKSWLAYLHAINRRNQYITAFSSVPLDTPQEEVADSSDDE